MNSKVNLSSHFKPPCLKSPRVTPSGLNKGRQKIKKKNNKNECDREKEAIMLTAICKLNSKANCRQTRQPILSNFLSFNEICSGSPRVNPRVGRGVLFFLFSPTSPGVLLKVAFMLLEPFFNVRIFKNFVSNILPRNKSWGAAPRCAPHASCISPI